MRRIIPYVNIQYASIRCKLASYSLNIDIFYLNGTYITCNIENAHNMSYILFSNIENAHNMSYILFSNIELYIFVIFTTNIFIYFCKSKNI